MHRHRQRRHSIIVNLRHFGLKFPSDNYRHSFLGTEGDGERPGGRRRGRAAAERAGGWQAKEGMGSGGGGGGDGAASGVGQLGVAWWRQVADVG